MTGRDIGMTNIWDIEENVEGEQLKEFTRYLNPEVLRDKIKFQRESVSIFGYKGPPQGGIFGSGNLF